MKLLSTTICATALLVTDSFAAGGVSAKTAGSSVDVSLTSSAFSKKINRYVNTRAQGGSIARARARAKYTQSSVTLGNEVIANKNIPGDSFPTHVDANSLFVGVATFKADRKGARVPNFKLKVKVHGSLKAKVSNPDVPEGNCIAGMGVDIIANRKRVFTGTAYQDGAGPFVANGDIASAFTTQANQASIDRSFSVNLGTLRDGQKIPFLFLGTTLVSFGTDVPVDFAEADFYRTSSFAPVSKKKGSLTLRPVAKTVDVGSIFVVDPFPENAIYIESADSSVIDNIDPKSVQVIIPTVGYFDEAPTVFDATPEAPADIDKDDIPDVRLVINRLDINQIITSSNTIIVFGLTKGGEPFTGTLLVP